MITNNAIQELQSSIAAAHYNTTLHIMHGRMDSAKTSLAEIALRRSELIEARDELLDQIDKINRSIGLLDQLCTPFDDIVAVVPEVRKAA